MAIYLSHYDNQQIGCTSTAYSASSPTNQNKNAPTNIYPAAKYARYDIHHAHVHGKQTKTRDAQHTDTDTPRSQAQAVATVSDGKKGRAKQDTKKQKPHPLPG